jgi:gluconokinase
MVLESGKVPLRFIVSGGVERSPSSLRRLANILNRPIYRNDTQEASLRGAAVYALERLGFKLPAPALSKPILPQRGYASLYAKERARQLALESVPLH